MAISLENLRTSTAKWPMILALYGVGGVGKTTFAASATKPIFIQTEDGAPEGVSFPTFG
ncbi:MAG: oxidoreductase, partial [Desulfocapsa sp.]